MPLPVTQSSKVMSDRLPPYNEEAERGVLGSILVDPARVMDLCVERGLAAESFYVPGHQVLYDVFFRMSSENRPVDLLTVSDRLKDLGLVEQVGGALYLDQLVDSTPTSAHAEYYITLVYEKHLFRRIINKAREAVESCYDAEEDAPSLLGKVEQSFFEISDQQRSAIKPWDKLVKGTMSEIETIFLEKKGITGLSTGFKDIDRVLLGLQPADMIILAARPSMGKTSLALNIAENIALGVGDSNPRPVGVFSLEMSSESLVRRMICCHARVSSHKLSSGFISREDHGYLMQAADALIKAPIYLDDTAGLEALELRARARRMKKRFGIELIVIDYLQMMNYTQFAREGRQRETAAISNAIKGMAKELSVPVLVLSQLSRAPETRGGLAIPKLSDLRDSGSIEQDADVVCLLRRPCRYKDDPEHDDNTLAILDVAKHRNGPVGEVRLHFEEDFTRFGDRRETGVDHDFQ